MNIFMVFDTFYQTAFQNDKHEEGGQKEQGHTDGGGVNGYNYFGKLAISTKAEHIYPITQQSVRIFFFRKAM